MTKLEIEIRELVAGYVFSNLPIEEFREKQVELQIKAESSGDSAALAVADELELLFAEVSASHRTELELRQGLRPLATVVRFALVGEIQPDIVLATTTTEVLETTNRLSFAELTIEAVPAS